MKANKNEKKFDNGIQQLLQVQNNWKINTQMIAPQFKEEEKDIFKAFEEVPVKDQQNSASYLDHQEFLVKQNDNQYPSQSQLHQLSDFSEELMKEIDLTEDSSQITQNFPDQNQINSVKSKFISDQRNELEKKLQELDDSFQFNFLQLNQSQFSNNSSTESSNTTDQNRFLQVENQEQLQYVDPELRFKEVKMVDKIDKSKQTPQSEKLEIIDGNIYQTPQFMERSQKSTDVSITTTDEPVRFQQIKFQKDSLFEEPRFKSLQGPQYESPKFFPSAKSEPVGIQYEEPVNLTEELRLKQKYEAEKQKILDNYNRQQSMIKNEIENEQTRMGSVIISQLNKIDEYISNNINYIESQDSKNQEAKEIKKKNQMESQLSILKKFVRLQDKQDKAEELQIQEGKYPYVTKKNQFILPEKKIDPAAEPFGQKMRFRQIQFESEQNQDHQGPSRSYQEQKAKQHIVHPYNQYQSKFMMSA